MPLTLRIRHPGGQATLADLPEATTVAELRELIAGKTTIPARRQLLKVGVPPAALPKDALTKPLGEAGIRNRETVTIEEREPSPEPACSGVAAAGASLATGSASCSLDLPAAPSSEIVGDLERHIIPADNSCLFNSVAYLLRERKAEAPRGPQELRDLVAQQIRDDPGRWDPITLAESGKPSLEYADWISKSESWGGSLELIIFSEHFSVQLCALCIRSLRVENFPYDSAAVQHRAYVAYDGIHYDAIVGRSTAGDELRVFGPKDDITLGKIVALGCDLQAQKQFTDTSSFTLQC